MKNMDGGLANLGNTCYVNTTVQCLGHCHEFLKFILTTKHLENTFASELAEIYDELYVKKNNISPNKFIKFLKNTITCLDILEQNDINEFLSLFLDRLNRHCSSSIHVSKKDLIEKYKYTNSDFDLQRFKMDMSWYEKTGKEYSPVVPLFNGQSISQIVCGNCDKIFHNYEIYLNLMLPVTETTSNIYDCLNEYFKAEHINTDSQIWTCDSCKHKSRSTKTIKLWRNPCILIVSLKRFTPELRKNSKKIDIPETLDISPYSLTNYSNNYTLVAVAHHCGSYNSGHYYAMCKGRDEVWYECDDLDIRKKTNPNHDYGYVYFYERL